MPNTSASSLKSSTKESSITNGKLSGEYLDRVKRKIGTKMDLVFERCLATDTDFPLCDSPVWVFGRSYSIHYGKDLDGRDLDELRRAVGTCLWFTYRKNFPPIGDSNLTSDKGWGCMIRAGQMVMAKALLLRYLGSEWHWDSTGRNPSYLQIVSLFADTRDAPLSIHQIAQRGATLGKPVGSWLGPNTVAQAFKKILSSDSTGLDLELVISMDSTLIKSEVKRTCLCSSNFLSSQSFPSSCSFNAPRPNPKWKPLVLFIPLRLGLTELNPAYIPAFRAVLEVKQNIGILGGRPNSALYFIGYAEDEVLFLDPHTVQPAVTIGCKIFETEKQADESYHLQKPGRMPFAAMDPSIAVCFYCPTEEDFDSLCSKLNESWSAAPLPLFEICERRPMDWIPSSSSTPLESPGKNFTSSQSWTCPTSGRNIYPQLHNPSKCEDNSPHNSSSGRSDGDEEFEILG